MFSFFSFLNGSFKKRKLGFDLCTKGPIFLRCISRSSKSTVRHRASSFHQQNIVSQHCDSGKIGSTSSTSQLE